MQKDQKEYSQSKFSVHLVRKNNNLLLLAKIEKEEDKLLASKGLLMLLIRFRIDS